ncbi:MAG: chemotaxis protein CheD [Oscillospiraceae bacterium]|nr:chemotaxis protein CheD [Oscillospiraceae bacterium]
MLTVGIADVRAVYVSEEDMLVTYALGSCVGICLYDRLSGIAGLAHIMLPWSKESYKGDDPLRYADTGLTELISRMCSMGAVKTRITAKIAGGAQMFGYASEAFNIGDRNICAVRKVLGAYGIPIVAESVGGTHARTLYFHTDTYIAEVKTAMKETIEL